jgi:nucleoside-triphosphatase
MDSSLALNSTFLVQILPHLTLAQRELASKQFSALVQRAFDAANPVVATVHRRRHPITDALKQRPDVGVIEVTKGNREGLPGLVLDELNRP